MELPNLNLKGEKPLDRLCSNGGFCAIFRRIAVIGDSLSSGEFQARTENGEFTYHDFYEYSWGQYLARMTGSTVYNFSRGGMTAKEYCETFADGQGFWNREKVCQAYIFALGVNDLIVRKEQTGELSDVDFLNPENNQKSFAGYFAKMIQKYRLLQPNAKFFLVTMPRSEDESENAIKKSHAELMYQFAEKFPHTYVIDLYQYAPVYDEAFRKAYYLYGHMSPCGYLLTAKMIASYIDYIVRSDMDAFKQVAFIGTPQYQEKIS